MNKAERELLENGAISHDAQYCAYSVKHSVLGVYQICLRAYLRGRIFLNSNTLIQFLANDRDRKLQISHFFVLFSPQFNCNQEKRIFGMNNLDCCL